MQNAAQKSPQNKKKKARKTAIKKKEEEVITLINVWKIFGMAAEEAMQAVQERGLGIHKN